MTKTEEDKQESLSWKTKAWVIVKKYKRLEIAAVIILALLIWGPSIYANLSTRSLRYNIDKTSIKNVPKKDVAIVFGAGVNRQTGEPTPYLQWRVETAVKLLKAGRVQKILMSGDNSIEKYNEPEAMKKWALKLGADDKDIVLDYAGYSTYDTCYRANYIFGVHEAVLVTQGYHLPRAVMTCNDLGVKSVGVAALRRGTDVEINYITREWLSTNKSTIQLIAKPKPTVLGNPEPIKS
jgi:vancomycin permeability regulator SanA